jgi:dTDP-4-dehydrorhamnose reductase
MVGAESAMAPLEIWAGVECTLNRVGNVYFDQLELNGHASRATDLQTFAALGIRTLRFPVLWERTAPHGIADWTWADERLAWMRDHNIRPIVGFLHHGSGPRDTNLLDPYFPAKLAKFALSFAERYPWVEHYTPINEPLTTARFSGLYGFWYPHGQDSGAFITIVLNQCKAIIESMKAIRSVNPAAQLVQTEDLGKTHSTPLLKYQADFENHRRWLGMDFLCGKVLPSHPLWRFLLRYGSNRKLVESFQEDCCPPNILGFNHYVTSERFLDERLVRYPAHTHGGNGRHRYADVEAVRVLKQGSEGSFSLLKEAWERYHLPLAVTEVHLGCTREEQMRWLMEVWKSCLELRDFGVDVRAVTPWSLLGSFDWNSLVTRQTGYYESGVYDIRCGNQLRETALAQMIRELAMGKEPAHPVLENVGWWRRPERLLFLPHDLGGREKSVVTPTFLSSRQKSGNVRHRILVAGGSGTLGHAFVRICERRGIEVLALSRRDLDICNPHQVKETLALVNPWAVINAAGYVQVDEAENDQEKCFLQNVKGPEYLAQECAKRGIPLLTFSSDLVFDGQRENPYSETNSVAPLSVYGDSKAEAESRVLAVHPNSLVVRTSAFFGPWDQYNFIYFVLRSLEESIDFHASHENVVSPTYVPDLVDACLDLLIDGEKGIWHLANQGAVSWYELAKRAAKHSGARLDHVKARASDELGWVAKRPRYSVLGSERGMMLPDLDHALHRFFREKLNTFKKR